MFRGFWCPYSIHDKWFFDKSVWQKMFRTMNGCGLNAMVLPGCGDLISASDPSRAAESQATDPEFAELLLDMRKWVLENALDYEILPYLSITSDLSPEASREYVRTALETYPEFAGVIGNTIYQGTDHLQNNVIDVVDAVRPDAAVVIELTSGPEGTADLRRRGDRSIRYLAQYSRLWVVDESPDARFTAWMETTGAENVIAEIYAINFNPWTSFSFDTVEGIVSNLEEAGCHGFLLRPLDGWPQTSDTYFKFAWQRDLVWYSVWGGTSVNQLIREGQPKWLVRNKKLIPGFQAGSRILEVLALYFKIAGPGFRPQFCSMSPNAFRLFTIDEMLRCSNDWWTQITGDMVVHLAEYVESGTPEDSYGPEELIEELTDLSGHAIAAGEKGMRSASGEKELPSFARDAFCTGRLGEFYIERIRAALSHARGNDQEAVEHMARAVGFYREIQAVDSAHRTGDPWSRTISALEAELEDARKGEFKRGEDYRIS